MTDTLPLDTETRSHHARRAVRIFSNASWVAITAIALVFIALLTAQASGSLTLDKVLTGSMEPTIMTGDYVLSRSSDGHALKQGAILTYSNPAAYGGLSITHRVHSVFGGRAVMQGDNNPGPDPYAISETDVRGVVVGHIGGSGARIIGEFVPTPQWRSDLLQAIYGDHHSLVPELWKDAPWGFVAALGLLLAVSVLDRIVLRSRPRG